MSCSHVVVSEVERGDFGKTGREGDWEERSEALLALQRLFEEAGKLEVPADRNAEAAFDAEAWRARGVSAGNARPARNGTRRAGARSGSPSRTPSRTCGPSSCV